MKKDMNIRGIDAEVIRNFRVACLSNGLTMKEKIVEYMEKFIKQSLTQK